MDLTLVLGAPSSEGGGAYEPTDDQVGLMQDFASASKAGDYKAMAAALYAFAMSCEGEGE